MCNQSSQHSVQFIESKRLQWLRNCAHICSPVVVLFAPSKRTEHLMAWESSTQVHFNGPVDFSGNGLAGVPMKIVWRLIRMSQVRCVDVVEKVCSCDAKPYRSTHSVRKAAVATQPRAEPLCELTALTVDVLLHTHVSTK